MCCELLVSAVFDLAEEQTNGVCSVLYSTCQVDDARRGDSTRCCLCCVSHGVFYASQCTCSMCFSVYNSRSNQCLVVKALFAGEQCVRIWHDDRVGH